MSRTRAAADDLCRVPETAHTAADPVRDVAAPPHTTAVPLRKVAEPSRTVAETLHYAAGVLVSKSESPRLDAELLLGKLLGLSRSALMVRATGCITAPQERAFADLLAQRVSGVPVAYLTGTREFWSLALTVTPAVLIPRPETELLVELALQLLPPCRLQHLPQDQSQLPPQDQLQNSPLCQVRSILDLGTGSGAIALAIASERPCCRVTAVDLSADALSVAMNNARCLGLVHIDWRQGTWFDAVPGRRFDLIAANPPYVAAADPVLRNLAAEPKLALAAGPTGLEALAAIAAGAAQHLNDGGWLLLEHGSTQAADVAQLLERHGFGGIRSHADGAGLPRVTLGSIHSQH